MDKRQKAKESLVWYFQLIAERAGVRWSEDNGTEVETIIDDILDAAVAEARAEIAKARQ